MTGDLTSILIDAGDDRWAFADQLDGSWKLYERSPHDDRVWIEVPGAHVTTYNQVVAERDERVRVEAEETRAELLND